MQNLWGKKILKNEHHREEAGKRIRGHNKDAQKEPPKEQMNRQYKAYIMNGALGGCQVSSSLGCRRTKRRSRRTVTPRQSLKKGS